MQLQKQQSKYTYKSALTQNKQKNVNDQKQTKN